MSILSIEASSRYLYLAFERGKDIQEKKILLDNNLCEILLTEIDSIAQGDINDLQEILVGDGPGSFTSLRIVFSTVKAMALALQIPVRKISVLTLLAYSCQEEGNLIIIPVTNARKHRLYCGFYNSDKTKVSDHQDLSLEQIFQYTEDLQDSYKVNNSELNFIFVTDDSDLEIDFSNFKFKSRLILCQENLASILLKFRQYARILEPFCGPDYVRPADAQVKLQNPENKI